MLPGTWAYVSAGAFGRAIIVSFYLVFLPLLCTLGYLVIIGLFLLSEKDGEHIECKLIC